MVYTPQDIFTRVQRQFGDESGVQIVMEDIRRWIDDAFREIYLQNDDMFIWEQTITSVAGQQNYTPANIALIQQIQAVQYNESNGLGYLPLKYLTPEEIDKMFPGWDATSNQTGTPLAYTRAHDGSGGFNISLYPVPDVGITNAIKLIFSRSAPQVNLDTTDLETLINPDYFPVILEFCLMKAYELDENWEAADRKAQYVQSTLNMLGFKRNNMNSKIYPSISQTDESYN